MTKKKIRSTVVKVYTDNINDPAKQIKEYRKMLKEAQEAADLYYAGFVFHMLAVAYNMLGDREKMFLNAVKSLAVFKNTDDHEMIADAYITLGAAYFNQENYQLALANYDKAYDIIKKHRIKGTSRQAVMNNLGTVCNLMGDYRAGIRYLTECLEQAKKETPDAYDELILYYVNLADSYIHVGDNEKAVEVFGEAEETAKKTGIISYVCDYRLKYAVACYRLNDKKQGNMNFDTAVKLASKMQDTFSDIEVFGDLTRILIKNKDIKRADKAVAIITEYGKTCSHTMDKLLVLSTLADYYKNTGDTMRAIGYYEQVEELYKVRTAELKQVQLSIHKSLKDADSAINKLNRMIKESEERASKDHMTKLLNHTAMLKVGGEFMNRAVKKKEKVGAIFIDIDCFKDCNDTYGHAKGDEIIKEVARACRAEENENVRFARYGGDEFIGLTYGLKDADLAEIAKKICLRVRKADIPNKMNPNGKRVTVSVGIANAAVTEKTDTVIQIINYADKAVYYSKKAGKNCIHLLDHDRTGINGEDAQFVRVDF